MKPVEWNRGVPRAKARESKNLIVALDIGTSKIAAIVARMNGWRNILPNISTTRRLALADVPLRKAISSGAV